MGVVLSYKGKPVDFALLAAQNGDTMVAGNVNINARGDLLGRGGRVVKTREQLEQEYYEKNPHAAKERPVIAGLNTNSISDMLRTPDTLAIMAEPVLEDAAEPVSLRHSTDPNVTVTFDQLSNNNNDANEFEPVAKKGRK